jgi:4-hydroxy-3-methylbut-2-enyl diphosphate reductase IspH
MCFGVRDAIELAQGRAAAGPVTILGDLVHNDTVLADLRGRGVLIRQDASDIPTREVLITAHGASNRRIEGLDPQRRWRNFDAFDLALNHAQ